MSKLRDSTILLLIKRTEGEISEICLAMKKRGFGVGRWNGVGGKKNEQDVTVEDTAIRETQEEINVLAKNMTKCAELTFHFPHNPDWDQLVHVYLCDEWEGEPQESEEMRPQWYAVNNLPFAEMWPDDKFWLPFVLKGKLLKATFCFKENDVLASQQVDIVSKL